mmetsp:Transcript_133650/g.298801  ORF Transcript_133650/g.298801 Transcript_133650/m.298801 type:complete len:332 (-) Transcript_133650:203-1198(-)
MSQEDRPVCTLEACGTQGEVHLMELEVVRHIDVRPVAGIEAREVVLLRAIPADMLWVRLVGDLREALLVDLPARLQQHDPSVDAAGLSPGPCPRPCATKEVAPVDALPVAIAGPGTTNQGCRRPELKEIIHVLPDEEVCIQEENLGVVHQLQRSQLREDVLKTRLQAELLVERVAGPDVLHQPRFPTRAPQQLNCSGRHIASVQDHEVVAGAGAAQRVAENHCAQDVSGVASPERHHIGKALLPRRRSIPTADNILGATPPPFPGRLPNRLAFLALEMDGKRALAACAKAVPADAAVAFWCAVAGTVWRLFRGHGPAGEGALTGRDDAQPR